MTVGELITDLEALDKDAEVVIVADGYYYPVIDSVQSRKEYISELLDDLDYCDRETTGEVVEAELPKKCVVLE